MCSICGGVVMIEKYIGSTLEIIYQDRNGIITQRKILVQSIKDGSLKALCLERHSIRIFKIKNILAYVPGEVKRYG
jgi:predicted DNA-binding transcriptional regulator YafY